MTNGLFKKIASLSDEELRKELMRYNIDDLKFNLKVYMSAAETRTKSKEVLIERVLKRREKSRFISEIGRGTQNDS